jgi:hypothetical protein
MLVQLSRLALAALLFTTALGCGGGSAPVTVNGKIVLLPNTKYAETDTLVLTFVSTAADGKGGGTADVAKDLSFTARVQPGNYKVAFSITPYTGAKDDERRAETFAKKYEAFSATKTPITYEVSSDSTQSVTIDLAQGKATRN